MPNARPRKRPCSICRRWFLPDVRQKGRQNTCSPECRKERHRRQCERWNRKNKSYFKDIYLSQKLERFSKPPPRQSGPDVGKKAIPASSARLHVHLPWDVIGNELEKRQLIIIEYCLGQLINHFRPNSTAFIQPGEIHRH